ncbi:MAG: ABC-2 family transporter protein [Patescibacteria group bacterium]|nr:ABC-2 family transporter protein [Patescibacteria group bacterium]
MRKYLLLARATLKTYLAYRVNFIMWRIRSMLTLVMLYFLWSQAVVGKSEIAGYAPAEIYTYIFLANFLNATVLSSRVDQLAGDILNGTIINHLLKPFSIFSLIGTREVVDKMVNILFSIAEIALFISIFRPPLAFPADPIAVLGFLAFLLLALVLSFYVSFALSMLAFWTAEVWAPRFIFLILISMLAGSLFPLDLFPPVLYNVMLLTPFPYMVYVPAKIFVDGITPQVLDFAIFGLGWLGLVASLAHMSWLRGMKEFSFFGR